MRAKVAMIRRLGRCVASVALGAALAGGLTGAARAADVYVDATNGHCSESGPGTSGAPYCSISAALAAHHAPGTVVHVMPGVYREMVTVGASGAAGSPIVLRGEGTAERPVLIEGSDDFSSTGLWTSTRGGVWLASSVDWSPAQVLVRGVALPLSHAPPESLGVHAYLYVAGVGLYVNLGGPNPGSTQIQIGHRPSGFRLSSRSWVTIDGFTVARSDDRGIFAGSCSNLEITNDVVEQCARAGIEVSRCTSLHLGSNQVSDSGLYGVGLTNGTTGCRVEGNRIVHNTSPSAPSGAGLYLAGASGNRIEANVLRDNGKAGVAFSQGADHNVSVLNVSWNNQGDGFDHFAATGTVHNGDVAFGNHGQGFSLVAGSTGTQIFDCVSFANGLRHYHFDLDVDALSTAGLVSNDNLYWNPSGNDPVRYGGVSYNRVTDFAAASGQDTRTIQQDPWLSNPLAGDFRPRPGSPLIDSGNSASPEWSSADAAGRPRVNDPFTPDRGMGPVHDADRGAFEYVPAEWARGVADTVPHLDHVIVVIMENKPYGLVAGAPYTASLISTYSSFANSYSYQHQSQSDYYALWSATGRRVTESICPAVGSPYFTENLGHRCETHGRSWKSYSEGLPVAGDPVCQVGRYARRHCPWADWGNLNHANERPYSDLAVDIARDSLPDLAFVIPNLCNDTHDVCGGDSIQYGDDWLAKNLPAMIHAVGRRGAVILTWDEDDGSDGNHILTVLASPLVKTGYVSSRFVNHFVMVRTICDALGVPPFAEASNAMPVTDVWEGESGPSPLPPAGQPVQLSLGLPGPNPFRGSVSLALELPGEERVRAEVFDLAGRRLKSLLDEPRSGLVRISWDGSRDGGGLAPAGVYLLRVRAGDTRFDRKLVMVK